MQPFFLNKPNSLKEVIGQDAATASISSFFTNFKKGTALFLYGPPGTGKTLIAREISKILKVEPKIVNGP